MRRFHRGASGNATLTIEAARSQRRVLASAREAIEGAYRRGLLPAEAFAFGCAVIRFVV
jgi:hypothetical protein